MKTVSQLLALALLLTFTVACDSNSNEEKATAVATPEKTLDLKANRGSAVAAQAMDRFSLEGVNINIEELDALVVRTKAAAADADAQAVSSINGAFMAAAKEAQILDVNFSMSDEPVGNGMFVFSIESPDNKSVTLEMFDEEGYNLAANNTFGINEGNNYKALNVSTLDDGDYLFRLKDDQGKELARTVSIEHKD